MKKIVVFSGRFQPFGPHHFQVYKHLINKFGSESVYIGTSNKVGEKSPLNFNEKKFIMMQFNIPEDKIRMVKNPYSPSEILQDFDREGTALIVAVGEKDSKRLNYDGSKEDGSSYYYTAYKDGMPLQPYSEKGYVHIIPNINIPLPKYGKMDSTALRSMIAKMHASHFKRLFGWFDRRAFNMMKSKFSLNEAYGRVKMRLEDGYIRYKKKVDEKVLNEIGDGSAGSYEFKDQFVILPVRGSYTFSTGTHDYIVNLSTSYDSSNYGIEVSFGVQAQGGHQSYGTTNNFRVMFKVMGTVTEIVKEFMRESKKERDINFSYIAFDSSTLKGDGDGEYLPAARKQRDKLYLKYIQSQFPNAKVDKEGSSKMRVYLKENKNTTSITEIGDGSAKPFKFERDDLDVVEADDGSTMIGRYTFKVEKFDDDYEVEMAYTDNDDSDRYVIVGFSLDGDLDTTNNFKELFKVMATVKVIVLDFIKRMKSSGYPVEGVAFQSSSFKGGKVDGNAADQRDELYLRYLKSAFPNSTIDRYSSWVNVTFNESRLVGGKREVLLEGGSYGHIKHLFEEKELIFNDLDVIVKELLTGEFNELSNVREKVDGQNLMVTFINGEIKVARNKGMLKAPLSLDELSQKEFNSKDVLKSFIDVSNIVNSTISTIDAEVLNEIFLSGKRFLNFEILNPNSGNVIKYSDQFLVAFLGMIEYDESFNISQEYFDDVVELIDFISQNNPTQEIQFKVVGDVEINNNDYKEAYNEFVDDIRDILDETDLSPTDTIGEYYKVKFKSIVESKFPELEDGLKQTLIERWAMKDKSTRMDKKVLGNSYQKFKDYETNDLKLDYGAIRHKIERPFVKLSANIFRSIDNLVAGSPDNGSGVIKGKLADTLKKIKTMSNDEIKDGLKTNLKKIEDYTKISDIYSTEGLVFDYSGKKLKLTGIFSVINQILGTFKY